MGCPKRTLKKCIFEHLADILHRRVNVLGTARHFIDKHEGSLHLKKKIGIEKVEKPNRAGNRE